MTTTGTTTEEASNRFTTNADQVLACFFDILEKDALEFIDYVAHCGIAIEDIKEAGQDWPSYERLILGHYRVKPGVYDLEQVAQDLASYPPVAAEIARLTRAKIHKEAEQEERRQKARDDRKRKAKTRRHLGNTQ